MVLTQDSRMCSALACCRAGRRQLTRLLYGRMGMKMVCDDRDWGGRRTLNLIRCWHALRETGSVHLGEVSSVIMFGKSKTVVDYGL